MLFHLFVVKRLNSNSELLEEDLMREGLDYTFKQQRKFRECLGQLTEDMNLAKIICNQLLDQQIEFVKSAWARVPEEKIPHLREPRHAYCLRPDMVLNPQKAAGLRVLI